MSYESDPNRHFQNPGETPQNSAAHGKSRGNAHGDGSWLFDEDAAGQSASPSQVPADPVQQWGVQKQTSGQASDDSWLLQMGEGQAPPVPYSEDPDMDMDDEDEFPAGSALSASYCEPESTATVMSRLLVPGVFVAAVAVGGMILWKSMHGLGTQVSDTNGSGMVAVEGPRDSGVRLKSPEPDGSVRSTNPNEAPLRGRIQRDGSIDLASQRAETGTQAGQAGFTPSGQTPAVSMPQRAAKEAPTDGEMASTADLETIQPDPTAPELDSQESLAFGEPVQASPYQGPWTLQAGVQPLPMLTLPPWGPAGPPSESGEPEQVAANDAPAEQTLDVDPSTELEAPEQGALASLDALDGDYELPFLWEDEPLADPSEVAMVSEGVEPAFASEEATSMPEPTDTHTTEEVALESNPSETTPSTEPQPVETLGDVTELAQATDPSSPTLGDSQSLVSDSSADPSSPDPSSSDPSSSDPSSSDPSGAEQAGSETATLGSISTQFWFPHAGGTLRLDLGPGTRGEAGDEASTVAQTNSSDAPEAVASEGEQTESSVTDRVALTVVDPFGWEGAEAIQALPPSTGFDASGRWRLGDVSEQPEPSFEVLPLVDSPSLADAADATDSESLAAGDSEMASTQPEPQTEESIATETVAQDTTTSEQGPIFEIDPAAVETQDEADSQGLALESAPEAELEPSFLTASEPEVALAPEATAIEPQAASESDLASLAGDASSAGGVGTDSTGAEALPLEPLAEGPEASLAPATEPSLGPAAAELQPLAATPTPVPPVEPVVVAPVDLAGAPVAEPQSEGAAPLASAPTTEPTAVASGPAVAPTGGESGLLELYSEWNLLDDQGQLQEVASTDWLGSRRSGDSNLPFAHAQGAGGDPASGPGTATSVQGTAEPATQEARAGVLRRRTDDGGHWLGTEVPMHALHGDTVLLTPNVGPVRVIAKDGETIDGRLHGMGQGYVWLENNIGRLTVPARRVERVERIDPGQYRDDKKSALDYTKLPKVRVKVKGGVFVGYELDREGNRITIRTEKGYKMTLVSDEITSANNFRPIGIRRDETQKD
ncbi:MAG TPA: hypothetical protein PLJ12_04780 [Planctomycetota bacterium]|nr:hypothetical protein [Planctomycetota bacterium]